MHNEEKVEAAKKDAGGDEKLIIKFAWPNKLVLFLGEAVFSQRPVRMSMLPPHVVDMLGEFPA